MTAEVNELGLTALVTSITGLSAVGAAAILARVRGRSAVGSPVIANWPPG
jgi:hypothetical protein